MGSRLTSKAMEYVGRLQFELTQLDRNLEDNGKLEDETEHRILRERYASLLGAARNVIEIGVGRSWRSWLIKSGNKGAKDEDHQTQFNERETYSGGGDRARRVTGRGQGAQQAGQEQRS